MTDQMKGAFMARRKNNSNHNHSKLKIIPLGGLGEIGKNMTVLEYENDINRH